MRKLDLAMTKRLTTRGKKGKHPKITAMRRQRILDWQKKRKARSTTDEAVAKRRARGGTAFSKKRNESPVVEKKTENKALAFSHPAKVALKKPRGVLSFMVEGMKKNAKKTNAERAREVLSDVKKIKTKTGDYRKKKKAGLRQGAISFGMDALLKRLRKKKK